MMALSLTFYRLTSCRTSDTVAFSALLNCPIMRQTICTLVVNYTDCGCLYAKARMASASTTPEYQTPSPCPQHIIPSCRY